MRNFLIKSFNTFNYSMLLWSNKIYHCFGSTLIKYLLLIFKQPIFITVMYFDIFLIELIGFDFHLMYAILIMILPKFIMRIIMNEIYKAVNIGNH